MCNFKKCINYSNSIFELGCFYEGILYKFGAEFDHPKDPCSECACMVS